MPFGDTFDGKANTRANYKSNPHSVPAAPRAGGKDCGGKENLRANAEDRGPSVPAGPGKGSDNRLPFDTFTDRTV